MTIRRVQHDADGGFLVNGDRAVPADPANRDYRNILRWIEDGNSPDPADPEPVFEPDDWRVRLEALAGKINLTAADMAAAKSKLSNREGR